MKTLMLTLLLLAGYLWTDNAVADNDTVEFCAAILLVTQNLEEYELWRERYDLRLVMVTQFQMILQHELEGKRIRAAEITAAADECVAARKEGEVK